MISNSITIYSSQICTILSALPPVNIVPSLLQAQLRSPFSTLCVPPTNVLQCLFTPSSTNGLISQVFIVPSMELLSRCVPFGLSAKHVTVSPCPFVFIVIYPPAPPAPPPFPPIVLTSHAFIKLSIPDGEYRVREEGRVGVATEGFVGGIIIVSLCISL